MGNAEPDDYDLNDAEQARWEAMVDEIQKERAAREEDVPPPESQSLSPEPIEVADAQDELRGDGTQASQDAPQDVKDAGEDVGYAGEPEGLAAPISEDGVPPPSDASSNLPDVIPPPEPEAPTEDTEEGVEASEYQQAFDSLLSEGESWMNKVQSDTDQQYNQSDRTQMEALIERSQEEGVRPFF